jgi:hypothetical protein
MIAFHEAMALLWDRDAKRPQALPHRTGGALIGIENLLRLADSPLGGFN